MCEDHRAVPLWLLIPLLILLSLSQSKSAAETAPVGDGQSKELHIVVWRYHLVGQKAYYRDLVRSYERANPGHHVVLKVEDWSRAHDELRSWTGHGDGPDLTVVPDVWLAEFASDLVPYPDREPPRFLHRFNGKMLERSRLRGQSMGLVWAASTKALFYRKDLFEKAGLAPPKNWSELRDAAEKLNDPPNRYGLAIPAAPQLDTADNFYFFLWSNGEELPDPGHPSRLESDASVQAITFMRDLHLKYHVTEPHPETCNRTCAEELFAQGKAAMVETGPWLIATIAAQPRPVPFSVAPLPENQCAATQLVTDYLVLFKHSHRQKEARRFIAFAYQREWRLRWAHLGMVPELRSVEADPAFSGDPIWNVFVSQLRVAHWIPLVSWQPIDAAISTTLSGVISGKLSPAPAMRRLSSQTAVLLRSGER